jgi:DNA-binding LytR/AlgR family response regulator
MIYSCVVITDHNEEVKFFKNQIALHEELEFIASYSNVYNVPANVYAHIAFININKSVLSGEAQIKLMRSNFEFIIFTGDNREYAATAYDLDGLDYLSKPIEASRFSQAFHKITRSVQKEQISEITLDSIFAIKDVNDNHNWVFNTYREIIAVESNKNYLRIYTEDGVHSTYLSLSKFEFNVLNLANFIRVHRSFIISKNHIRKSTQSLIYFRNSNIKIPIGVNYKKSLQEFINAISLNK